MAVKSRSTNLASWKREQRLHRLWLKINKAWFAQARAEAQDITSEEIKSDSLGSTPTNSQSSRAYGQGLRPSAEQSQHFPNSSADSTPSRTREQHLSRSIGGSGLPSNLPPRPRREAGDVGPPPKWEPRTQITFGDTGQPSNSNWPSSSPPGEVTVWHESFYDISIIQGPRCGQMVNGMHCFQAILEPRKGLENDLFHKIVESQQGHLAIPAFEKTFSIHGMARRMHNLLHKRDFSGFVLDCQILLCGKLESNLSPRLVVTCNGKYANPILKKNLHKRCVTSTTQTYKWLPYEVSAQCPAHGSLPTQRIAADEVTSDQEEAKPGPTGYWDSTSDKDSHDDLLDQGFVESSLSGSGAFDAVSKVFVIGKVGPDRKIQLPQKVYIGPSHDHMSAATVGGLFHIKGQERVYGLTAGHAVHPLATRYCGPPSPKPEGKSTADAGNQASETVPNWGKVRQYTQIGTVVQFSRPPLHASDWAMVKFDDEFEILDTTTPTGISGPRLDFPKVRKEFHKKVHIHLDGFILDGYLGPYPRLIHIVGDPFWLLTYPIQLQGTNRPEPGDCGSWVTDTDNAFCGHICFRSKDFRYAWMVPAERMITEILISVEEADSEGELDLFDTSGNLSTSASSSDLTENIVQPDET